MKKMVAIIILLVILSSLVFATSGYFEPCDIHPFSLFYYPMTNRMYMGCLKYDNSLKLIVTDPLALNPERTFLLDGLIEHIYPINNGNSLLVLLSDVDGNAGTEDGELRQIAYSDGHTEQQFPFSTCPLGLIVDSQENYAYVSSGLDAYSVDPIITKINLSTWLRVGTDVKFGRFSNCLALTHDDSKLYIKNELIARHDHVNDRYYYEIGVFDTSDMSVLNPIEIEAWPCVLKMGYDNRLYISSAVPENGEPALIVIDTSTDTVTPLFYPNVGFEDISVDGTNCKLYCAAYTNQVNPKTGGLVLAPSNLVYQIDLENNYSCEVFVPAEEPLALIEAVPIDDPNFSCRLFATAAKGKKVYYMDIE